MNVLRVNRERLWDSLMQMAEIGATENGGSCRLALSDEDKVGRDLFIDWCKDAGCSIEIDRMGNIFATRAGRSNRLPIATGSHLDTQPHGGRFDGVYGVLAGLEVIRSLNDHHVETEAAIEVIVWTNEEGCRFAPAMVASGVYAGLFELDYALERADETGVTMGAELERIGYAGDRPCGEHALGTLFEAHIEQGPILEQADDTIGVVTGAQGTRWYTVSITGQDAHAGSTPMVGRRDAVVAAAALIESVERIAHERSPQAVGTVGALTVSPNSQNTIAGHVELRVDMRHPDARMMTEMDGALRDSAATIAEARSVMINVDDIWYKPPVVFDSDCIASVREAAATLGYSHQDIVSGAGHDACQVCSVAPTAMIFVPCAGGLSHNEAESAKPEDLEAGCNVLLKAMVERSGVVEA